MEILKMRLFCTSAVSLGAAFRDELLLASLASAWESWIVYATMWLGRAACMNAVAIETKWLLLYWNEPHCTLRRTGAENFALHLAIQSKEPGHHKSDKLLYWLNK